MKFRRTYKLDLPLFSNTDILSSDKRRTLISCNVLSYWLNNLLNNKGYFKIESLFTNVVQGKGKSPWSSKQAWLGNMYNEVLSFTSDPIVKSCILSSRAFHTYLARFIFLKNNPSYFLDIKNMPSEKDFVYLIDKYKKQYPGTSSDFMLVLQSSLIKYKEYIGYTGTYNIDPIFNITKTIAKGLMGKGLEDTLVYDLCLNIVLDFHLGNVPGCFYLVATQAKHVSLLKKVLKVSHDYVKSPNIKHKKKKACDTYPQYISEEVNKIRFCPTDTLGALTNDYLNGKFNYEITVDETDEDNKQIELDNNMKEFLKMEGPKTQNSSCEEETDEYETDYEDNFIVDLKENIKNKVGKESIKAFIEFVEKREIDISYYALSDIFQHFNISEKNLDTLIEFNYMKCDGVNICIKSLKEFIKSPLFNQAVVLGITYKPIPDKEQTLKDYCDYNNSDYSILKSLYKKWVKSTKAIPTTTLSFEVSSKFSEYLNNKELKFKRNKATKALNNQRFNSYEEFEELIKEEIERSFRPLLDNISIRNLVNAWRVRGNRVEDLPIKIKYDPSTFRLYLQDDKYNILSEKVKELTPTSANWDLANYLVETLCKVHPFIAQNIYNSIVVSLLDKTEECIRDKVLFYVWVMKLRLYRGCYHITQHTVNSMLSDSSYGNIENGIGKPKSESDFYILDDFIHPLPTGNCNIPRNCTRSIPRDAVLYGKPFNWSKSSKTYEESLKVNPRHNREQETISEELKEYKKEVIISIPSNELNVGCESSMRKGDEKDILNTSGELELVGEDKIVLDTMQELYNNRPSRTVRKELPSVVEVKFIDQVTGEELCISKKANSERARLLFNSINALLME